MRAISSIWELLLGPRVVRTKGTTSTYRKSPIAVYDWVLNSEIDHFVRVSLLRVSLANYEDSTPGLRFGPALIQWTNVFIFNKQFIRDHFQANRNDLSFPANCQHHCGGSNCSCAQDEFFPHNYGPRSVEGRSVFHLTSAIIQKPYQCEVALFDLVPGWKSAGGRYRFPPLTNSSISSSGERQLEFIRKLSELRESNVPCTAQTQLPDKNVVFLHHVGTARVHSLAEHLLGFRT